MDCYSCSNMTDPLTKIARAAKARQSMPALIREAREAGKTWEQIAVAAMMSRAGVIKLSKL